MLVTIKLFRLETAKNYGIVGLLFFQLINQHIFEYENKVLLSRNDNIFLWILSLLIERPFNIR